MREYDLIADWYAESRKGDVGVPEVQAFAASLPRGASVLDVGCGAGIPLTTVLVQAGFDVLGVDSSPRMVEKFSHNLPGTPIICSPIQSCVLPDATFDAVLSCGMIFHLPHSEQAIVFAKVAQALKPGGRFLFTSGDSGEEGDGGIQGAPMHGVPFRYWSMTPAAYRNALDRFGLTLIDTRRDAGGNVYYLAEKQRPRRYH